MRAGLALLSLLLVFSSDARADDARRRFRIAGAGTLVIPLRETWNAAGDKDGSLLYRAPGGEMLILTVLQNKEGRSDFTAPARLRQELEAAGKPHLEHTAEKAIDLVEIQGTSNTGYYFSLTDSNLVGKEPGPSEYRAITEGMLGVKNELLLKFTVLSQQRDATAVQQALAAMRSASLEPLR